MQRILRWVIGLPLLVFVIGFAVANRQSVRLSFNPLQPSSTFASLELPLWLLFFFGIVVGIFAGWTACWFAQGKHRKRAREAAAEISKLSEERSDLLRRVEPGQARDTDQQIAPLGSGMGSGWV